MITGSIINAAAILIGALAGVIIKWLACHLSGRLSRKTGMVLRIFTSFSISQVAVSNSSSVPARARVSPQGSMMAELPP